MSSNSTLGGQTLDALERMLVATPYHLVRYIGRGGMGAVFEIEHRFLGRRFVLKVLHTRLADQPQFVDRMRIEAQSMAQLHHPNVVDVVDFWTAEDGRPCLVMELLKGKTLAQELGARRAIPWVESVGVTRQTLAALAAAHSVGIVHRDIKPENIFLHDQGAKVVVKVLDFGVARVLGEGPRGSILPLTIPTTTGTIVGSPRFVSPEGALGERVDHRADIYSVGLLLYLMLAGRGPFDSFAVGVPQPPSTLGAQVPVELDALVMRALEELPQSRFQSAAEFSDALAALVPRSPSQWPA